MSFSIVIPSRNIANLTACVAAIRKSGETARVIVVNDGIHWDTGWDEASEPEVYVEQGVKPFSFAANVNLGIRAAGRDNVLILNDDALLETPRGFSLMVEHLGCAAEGWGILACSTNVTGYPLQQRRPCPNQRRLREVPFAAFIGVLIPRRTIDVVGLLD